MPNTVINVSGDERGARLTIAVPVPELRLALPPGVAKDADLGSASSRRALRSYFDSHLSILSAAGAKQAHVIESIELMRSTDPDVGEYQELALQAWVPATPTFDPRAFTLEYDAVIHQVPNHSALVQVTSAATPPVAASLITFDFSRNGTRPLSIRLDGERRDAGAPMLWALGGLLVVGVFCVIRVRAGRSLTPQAAAGRDPAA